MYSVPIAHDGGVDTLHTTEGPIYASLGAIAETKTSQRRGSSLTISCEYQWGRRETGENRPCRYPTKKASLSGIVFEITAYERSAG